MNRKGLPPLTWLRAFEAAGRLGSLKEAATELNVSASTISHQVRDLENRVGFPLFARAGRGLALTHEGERYSRLLTRAFELLRAATDDIPVRDSSRFKIGAFPFLLNEVLAPRSSELASTLDVSVVALHGHTSLDALHHSNPSERLDAVIRYSQSGRSF